MVNRISDHASLQEMILAVRLRLLLDSGLQGGAKFRMTAAEIRGGGENIGAVTPGEPDGDGARGDKDGEQQRRGVRRQIGKTLLCYGESRRDDGDSQPDYQSGSMEMNRTQPTRDPL